MTQVLEDLRKEVSANTDLVQSAVALIHGLADKIEAAKGDEAALQKLADDLRANDQSLASAVSANTPTAPSDGDAGGQGGSPTGAPVQ